MLVITVDKSGVALNSTVSGVFTCKSRLDWRYDSPGSEPSVGDADLEKIFRPLLNWSQLFHPNYPNSVSSENKQMGFYVWRDAVFVSVLSESLKKYRWLSCRSFNVATLGADTQKHTKHITIPCRTSTFRRVSKYSLMLRKFCGTLISSVHIF
jgi:hypothetical protein